MAVLNHGLNRLNEDFQLSLRLLKEIHSVPARIRTTWHCQRSDRAEAKPHLFLCGIDPNYE